MKHMKLMKRIASIALAVAMTMSMSMSINVYADDSVGKTGKIEVTDANIGETYTGYKIFDVTYNGDNYAYTIDKANTTIYNLIKNYQYNEKDVFSLDEPTEGTICVVTVNSEANFSGEEAAKDFANYLAAHLPVVTVPTITVDEEEVTIYKVADFVDTNDNGVIDAEEEYTDLTSADNANYIVENFISEELVAVGTETETSVSWDNLSLGYWFVKTSVGSLCILDTTNNVVTIGDKNPDTSIEKKVKEDSTGEWGDSNTAEVGDVVEYKTAFEVKPGARNYKLYDKMTEGLAFNDDIIVYIDADKDKNLDYTDNNNNNTFDSGDVITEATLDDTNYQVQKNVTKVEKDGTGVECDFVIVFDQAYLDTITETTALIVTYSAILNDNAVVTIKAEGDANRNDTKLEWGNNSSTEWDTTQTYSLYFDLIKTDNVEGVYTYLEGAQFELYYDSDCNNKVILRTTDNPGEYKVATEEWKNSHKDEDGNYVSEIINAGQAKILGLDANTTYYLKEIAAPAGYNMINEPKNVEIKEESIATTFDVKNASPFVPTTHGGVHVINQTGIELPSTGGAGTTIFYLVGGILVIGAVVLLVTRKRMSNEA